MPTLVESKIGLAPQSFTLHARNPERNVEIGGALHGVLLGRIDAQFAFDREGGRRPGNHRDFQNFVRLGQSARRRACVGRLSR